MLCLHFPALQMWSPQSQTQEPSLVWLCPQENFYGKGWWTSAGMLQKQIFFVFRTFYRGRKRNSVQRRCNKNLRDLPALIFFLHRWLCLTSSCSTETKAQIKQERREDGLLTAVPHQRGAAQWLKVSHFTWRSEVSNITTAAAALTLTSAGDLLTLVPGSWGVTVLSVHIHLCVFRNSFHSAIKFMWCEMWRRTYKQWHQKKDSNPGQKTRLTHDDITDRGQQTNWNSPDS